MPNRYSPINNKEEFFDRAEKYLIDKKIELNGYKIEENILSKRLIALLKKLGPLIPEDEKKIIKDEILEVVELMRMYCPSKYIKMMSFLNS